MSSARSTIKGVIRPILLTVRGFVVRYGLLFVAAVGLVVVVLSVTGGGRPEDTVVEPEPLPPVPTTEPADIVADAAAEQLVVEGAGTPAEPVVVAALGPWTTDGDILLAAGGTDAPGDTAVYTAFCGGQPCGAEETRWTVDGVARTDNPMELRVGTVGVHPVRVEVTGRPVPARTYRAVGVPRSADVPIDGWATGAAAPTDRLRALVYAEEVGWLPPCAVPPGQPRRVCADPAGEINVVPRDEPVGPVLPPTTGPAGQSDDSSQEPESAADRGETPEPTVTPGSDDQPVADDGRPADPLTGVFGDEPVSVSTLTAPDGTDAVVGDCADRWTPILVRGEFVLGEGLEQGCVSRGDLSAAASSAAARPVTLPRCPPQPEPTVDPEPSPTATTVEGEREPLGPPPCNDLAAATVTDLYTVAAEVALVDGFGLSCAEVGLPSGCPAPAVSVVAAGGPHGPASAGSDDPVSRGDVAEVLAWASGNRWLFDPIAAATQPVHADIGEEATVTLGLALPSHWPSPTLVWPDIDGLYRDCGATAPTNRTTCGYRVLRPGTHRGEVTLVAGPFMTTVPIVVTADPPPPELRVDVIQQAPSSGSADWVVLADRPVGFWSLTDPTGATSLSASGAGWSVAIVESTALRARVRVSGTPAAGLVVTGCSTGRCGTVALERGSGQVVSVNVDGTSSPVGDIVVRVSTDGPVDLGERLVGFTPVGASPLSLVADAYGEAPRVIGDGDPVDGPVVLQTPGWWTSGLGGVEMVLSGPAGTVTVVVTHPDDADPGLTGPE